MRGSRGLFLFSLVCTLFLVLGFSGVGHAQVTTGTISGRVTDQQGDAVPAATVQAVNADTNVTRTAHTNTAGEYVFPFLPPGPYRLVIRKTGFQEIIKSGLTLHIQQTIAQNFVLQVGSVSQSVQVTSSRPVMQTQSASVGQVIETKTIGTLPLNGRDYTQLVTLTAGATPNHFSRVSNGFSLSGGQTLQTSILLNGLENVNRILGTGSTHTINALTPSVDAIREFSVKTGNYSAEYGHSAGGVVSVVIKSGTNQFHGDAFDFLRNDKLDANDYFAKRSGLARPPLRRNQFGGTLGGPIIRNHSFFFVSYQGTREASSTSGITTVPTLQQYNEIQNGQPVSFGSTNVYNPFDVVGGVRQQFTNNTIPVSDMNTAGLKIAQLYPKPNLSGTVNNYAFTQSHVDNQDELDSRFDEQLGNKDTAFLTYDRGTGTVSSGAICPGPGHCGTNGTFPLTQPLRAWSMAIGETHIFSSSVVNDFRIGYLHDGTNPNSIATKPLFQQYDLGGIPLLPGLNGLPSIAISGYSSLGDRLFTPNPKLVQITQGTDNVSWIHGDHDIKFGAQVIYTHNYGNTYADNRGTYHFNGQFTSEIPGKGHGPALADLLLGQTSTGTLSSTETGRFRSRYFGVYGQDTWKVTPSLTLDMGLRYNIQTPMWERNNAMSNFITNPASPEYGTFVLAKPGSFLNRTFMNLDATEIAPRLGIAYEINSSTVVRAGAGIFYGGLGYQGSNQTGIGNLPFSVRVSVPSATNAATTDLLLSTGFPSGILSPTNVKHPSTWSYVPNFPMPRVDQWNLSVERTFAANNSVTVAYVGSSSYDILSNNDLNAPPPGPGALNPRRPLPQFGSNTTVSPYGHSTYEALQVSFKRRFSQGLSVLSNYTWSRTIGNVENAENTGTPGTPQDPNNVAAEKALSPISVPQHFVASVIYQLPFGKQGSFLGSSAVSRAIVGGWELGGIFTVQHGYPLTPTVSPDPANNGTPARPDRLCNGNLPHGNGSVSEWYNPACFAPAAPYTFGNSGRDVIYAPGLTNLDFLLDRTFSLHESQSLEFRAEFFNFTNSVHFGAPNMTVTNRQAGTITSVSSPNREIEFALRFRF